MSITYMALGISNESTNSGTDMGDVALTSWRFVDDSSPLTQLVVSEVSWHRGQMANRGTAVAPNKIPFYCGREAKPIT